MLSIFLVIIGLLVVTFGSDWLVDGATAVARRLQVSDLVIGLTIVALGTSAPELVVNLFASYKGSTDLAIGNVLGSNIFNILLILGISAIITPVRVYSNTIWIEIPLTLLAALMVAICANDIFLDGAVTAQISRSEGLTLLGFFSVFMYYSFYVAKKNIPDIAAQTHDLMPVWKGILLLLAGIGALVLGGKLMVDGAIVIARNFGISENVIGITVVATGTSIPELATSIAAARKRQTDIAIGNVVGSNIFNIFLVLGISSTIRPLPFNQHTNLDVIITIFVSLLLFVFAFVGKSRTISRFEGVIFVICYLVYISYLVYGQIA